MSFTYHLRTDTIADEEGKEYTVYGISTISHNGNIVKSVPDIFFDVKLAENLVTKCNKYKLSLVHLMDVIDDALTEQYAL